MDYKDFTPSYSYRHISTDKMDMDADEYWTPKVLTTRKKLSNLYDRISEEAPVSILRHIVKLEWNVGVWDIERVANSQHRRRNLITNSNWEPIHTTFHGVPYGVFLEEGMVILLLSDETIEWLNHVTSLYSPKQVPQEIV